jgi:hypothetical protein
MIHAALLLLMLEAAITGLVSSSAWSAAAKKSFSYPQAAADYPILRAILLQKSVEGFWRVISQKSAATSS